MFVNKLAHTEGPSVDWHFREIIILACYASGIGLPLMCG